MELNQLLIATVMEDLRAGDKAEVVIDHEQGFAYVRTLHARNTSQTQ